MIVKRDDEIANYQKEKYYTVELSMNGFTLSTDRIDDEVTAEQLISLVGDKIEITDVIQKEKITKPDLPFDLTTLQRECNKYFGYSAKQTLDYAQSLYEKKLITYPRTDSRCLTEDMIVSTVRDYSSGYPAKMIIDDEKITVENSNLAHGMGALDLQKFEPFPKNPAISKVFREIGLADELGSGMRNTYKYTQLYSGENPLFEEGDIFRTIIPLKKIATQKVGGDNVAHDVAQCVVHDVAHDKIALAEFIKEKVRSNDRITRKAIADEAGVSVKTIERAIKEIDNLKYVGSGNSGHWELNE